jgi:hypothetical protein
LPNRVFPSLDNWGNQICKTLDTGQTTTIQGSVENCPIGTHPWVDAWGNKMCQSFNGGAQYYDTSGGCPIAYEIAEAMESAGMETAR